MFGLVPYVSKGAWSIGKACIPDDSRYWFGRTLHEQTSLPSRMCPRSLHTLPDPSSLHLSLLCVVSHLLQLF